MLELGKWADSRSSPQRPPILIARVAAGMANDLVSTIQGSPPIPGCRGARHEPRWLRAGHPLYPGRRSLPAGCWRGDQTAVQPPAATSPGENARSANYRRHGRAAFRLLSKISVQHLNLMITAGPTREPLDPVRVISPTTAPGKMGFAIAAAALAART